VLRLLVWFRPPALRAAPEGARFPFRIGHWH
jgi:hypothetical protein